MIKEIRRILSNVERYVEKLYAENQRLRKQQKPTVTMTEIENAVGDTGAEYTEGVVELFESKGFEVDEGGKT